MRASYGCPCNDEDYVGRIEPDRTDGIFSTVREWTGDEPIGCPWSAFRDPFVGRVLTAFSAYDKGQLDTVCPDASHRLVEGVTHYAWVDARCTRVRWEKDKADRERERAGGRLG